MKNFTTRYYLSIFIAFFFLLCPFWAHAEIDSTEITRRLSADIKKATEITNYFENTEDSLETIIRNLNTYKTYYAGSIKFYNDNSSNVTESLKPVLFNIIKAETDISTGLDTLIYSLNNSDETIYNKGQDEYNRGIDELNRAAKQHDEAVGAEDFGPIYIPASIISSLISIALLIKSRAKVVGEFSQTKRDVMMGLFKSSLWPTIGSLITTIWYYVTPPGSTYYILWGPMIIGFAYFLKAIWDYSKIRKLLKAGVKKEYEEWEIAENKKLEKLAKENKYCPHCGFQYSRRDKFCGGCGEKL